MEKNQFEKNMNEIFDLPEEQESIPAGIGEILDEVKDISIINNEEDKEKDLQKDYRTVRKNLRDIVKKGTEAIDGILMVASEGQNPRAYEVVSQLIKSVSDANKDLLQLHKQMKEIRKEDQNFSRGPSTVNNSIFVGSTKELQELLKNKKKELTQLEDENILDVGE